MHALTLSLKNIPSNGEISDDEENDDHEGRYARKRATKKRKLMNSDTK